MMPTPHQPPVRSLEFYYTDGNIVFQVRIRSFSSPSRHRLIKRICPQVSNILYRLHRSILAARLDLFGGMFLLSSGQQNPQDGQDDDHAVQIEDGVAVREDFEALVKHIYGQCVLFASVAEVAN